MDQYFDDDGDSTILTDEFLALLQDELSIIDAAIALGNSDAKVLRELQRRRSHIAKELIAGRYLPIPEDE